MPSKTPNYDAKVKEILDGLTPGQRTCEITGQTWDMTEEEIGWYKKFNVPPSRVAPHTRWQLAIGFYIGYQWWWNKHWETGEPVLSGVHPATGLKVLPDKEWFNHDFSKDEQGYSPEQPFFDQFRQLQLQIPIMATRNFEETKNSIAMVSSGDINSYFVLACETKDSLYSVSAETEGSCLVNWSKNAIDSFYVSDSDEVFNSQYVFDSAQVMDSSFVFGCKDIRNCFFATNQSHKQYLWYDKQLTQEEYEKRISKIDFTCRSTLEKYEKEFFDHLNKEAIWVESMIVNAPDCTGEYIVDCLNCKHSFALAWGVRDCYWVIHNYYKAEQNAFVTGAYGTSESYYSSSLAECSRIRYSNQLKSCKDLEYCLDCFNCEYCFGCVGLNRKRFYIFNKEYSEDEYWQRVDQLKCAMLDRGEYGEYFPLKYSPCYMPQSGPAMYLLTKDSELAQLGVLDFDPESEGAIGEDLSRADNPIPSSEIPDCFPDNLEEWVGKPIYDEKFKRKFSLIKPEIDFYKKKGLPMPNDHFISRFQKLNYIMNGALFKEHECQKCGKEIQVAENRTFPDRIIYCRECYLKYLEERG